MMTNSGLLTRFSFSAATLPECDYIIARYYACFLEEPVSVINWKGKERILLPVNFINTVKSLTVLTELAFPPAPFFFFFNGIIEPLTSRQILLRKQAK